MGKSREDLENSSSKSLEIGEEISSIEDKSSLINKYPHLHAYLNSEPNFASGSKLISLLKEIKTISDTDEFANVRSIIENTSNNHALSQQEKHIEIKNKINEIFNSDLNFNRVKNKNLIGNLHTQNVLVNTPEEVVIPGQAYVNELANKIKQLTRAYGNDKRFGIPNRHNKLASKITHHVEAIQKQNISEYAKYCKLVDLIENTNKTLATFPKSRLLQGVNVGKHHVLGFQEILPEYKEIKLHMDLQKGIGELRKGNYHIFFGIMQQVISQIPDSELDAKFIELLKETNINLKDFLEINKLSNINKKDWPLIQKIVQAKNHNVLPENLLDFIQGSFLKFLIEKEAPTSTKVSEINTQELLNQFRLGNFLPLLKTFDSSKWYLEHTGDLNEEGADFILPLTILMFLKTNINIQDLKDLIKLVEMQILPGVYQYAIANLIGTFTAVLAHKSSNDVPFEGTLDTKENIEIAMKQFDSELGNDSIARWTEENNRDNILYSSTEQTNVSISFNLETTKFLYGVNSEQFTDKLFSQPETAFEPIRLTSVEFKIVVENKIKRFNDIITNSNNDANQIENDNVYEGTDTDVQSVRPDTSPVAESQNINAKKLKLLKDIKLLIEHTEWKFKFGHGTTLRVNGTEIQVPKSVAAIYKLCNADDKAAAKNLDTIYEIAKTASQQKFTNFFLRDKQTQKFYESFRDSNYTPSPRKIK